MIRCGSYFLLTGHSLCNDVMSPPRLGRIPMPGLSCKGPGVMYQDLCGSVARKPSGSVARKPSVVRTCSEFQEDSSWKSEPADKPVILMSQKIIIVMEHPFPSNAKGTQYPLTTPTLPLSTYRLLPYFCARFYILIYLDAC